MSKGGEVVVDLTKPNIFTKKPVSVFAIKWDGSNFTECKEFLGDDFVKCFSERRPNGKSDIIIKTLEGEIVASRGDYIIRGVKGEHYPCKPDIFEQTYEIRVISVV